MEQSLENLEINVLLELAIKKAGKDAVAQALRSIITGQKRGRPDFIELIIENCNRKEQPAGIIFAANLVRQISHATWYRLVKRKNEIPEEVFKELENIRKLEKQGKGLESIGLLASKLYSRMR